MFQHMAILTECFEVLHDIQPPFREAFLMVHVEHDILVSVPVLSIPIFTIFPILTILTVPVLTVLPVSMGELFFTFYTGVIIPDQDIPFYLRPRDLGADARGVHLLFLDRIPVEFVIPRFAGGTAEPSPPVHDLFPTIFTQNKIHLPRNPFPAEFPVPVQPFFVVRKKYDLCDGITVASVKRLWVM